MASSAPPSSPPDTSGDRLDVLILAALEDELSGVLGLADAREEKADRAGFPPPPGG